MKHLSSIAADKENKSLIKALAWEVIGKKEPNTLLSDAVSCASSSLKESDLSETGEIPAYGASGLSGYTEQCLSVKDSILITKDGSGVYLLQTCWIYRKETS